MESDCGKLLCGVPVGTCIQLMVWAGRGGVTVKYPTSLMY